MWTRRAAPRLTPDKDTFVSTGLPSFPATAQTRPRYEAPHLFTNYPSLHRCTPLTPSLCPTHWRSGLWGFCLACRILFAILTPAAHIQHDFNFHNFINFFKQGIFEAPVYPPDRAHLTITAQQRCCRLCDGTPALTSWVSLFTEMLKTDS